MTLERQNSSFTKRPHGNCPIMQPAGDVIPNPPLYPPNHSRLPRPLIDVMGSLVLGPVQCVCVAQRVLRLPGSGPHSRPGPSPSVRLAALQRQGDGLWSSEEGAMRALHPSNLSLHGPWASFQFLAQLIFLRRHTLTHSRISFLLHHLPLCHLSPNNSIYSLLFRQTIATLYTTAAH